MHFPQIIDMWGIDDCEFKVHISNMKTTTSRAIITALIAVLALTGNAARRPVDASTRRPVAAHISAR